MYLLEMNYTCGSELPINESREGKCVILFMVKLSIKQNELFLMNTLKKCI